MNADVSSWATETRKEVVSQMDELDIRHYPYSPNKVPLRKALKQRLVRRRDMINKISYTMPRSAVFVHKGVSRGHPISNPRKIKQFFNPVIDERIEKLADLVAEHSGNIIINALQIK
jgi:hypothetical protein